MSTSEIAFLAIGLVLGAVLGAALAQVLRARPAPRREVRLTITPNAIPPRRAQTLSSTQAVPSSTPAIGSPDAAARADSRPAVPQPAAPAPRTDMPGATVPRTRVPSGGVVLPSTAVAVPVGEAPPVPVAAPASNAAGSAPTAAHDTRPSVTPPRQQQNPGPMASASAAPAAAIVVGTATAVAVMEAPERPRVSIVVPPATLPRPASGAPATRHVAPPDLLPRHDQAHRDPARRDQARETGLRVEGFTTLVRPRPPVEAPRPSLPAGAIPVAVPSAVRPVPAVRPAPLIGGIAPVARPALAPPSGPTLTRPRAGSQPRAGSGSPDGPAGAPGAAGAAVDPCAGPRRAVDERCALAEVAREQARRAADALREAQRAYDTLRDGVDRAEAQADPRQIAAAKERLHAAFRAASERAGTAEETEAAARAWLNEINALNNAVREAQRAVEAGTAELRSRIGALERLAAEADAARIAGENAESGCREAREDLAGCEEADARAREALPPERAEPHPFAGVWPEEQPDMPERPAPVDLLAGLPLIVRVLRGDREARERLVAMLAAGDQDAARDWGLRVSRLADAISGRAIEDGYLDLPEDDAFWRLFSYRERRDIVGALSALGFRYDGMGGFADERAPAARDLSLAVGYAGLDRMRIRTWPRDSEIAVLYERAMVAADEWLADQAGDLTLGRMVDALGNRAADLADVWNAWGRVRPALLST